MDTSRVKQRLQVILKQRGVRGVIGLQQSFNEFDLDKNGTLSWEEFNYAMQKCGLAPSPQDSRALFLEFDVDGSNEVSYDEFIRALRGDLSAKRRNIITKVFESIDSDGDGIISMTDIGTCFNPKNHPDVKSGKTSVPTLLKDFFETFNTVTSNGYVSLEQFLEYYTNASFFEDDSTFEATMASVWRAPNVSNTAGSSKGSTSLHSIANSRAQHHSSGISAPAAYDDDELPALAELKTQLKARGARGIIGLSRKFRIMDDSGNKVLDMLEFKKGIRECGLKLSEHELNQLYSHLDKDRSGGVDFEEFLSSIRGSLSPRRKNLVGMAFDKMDKTGNGVIDPEDVIDTYDASKHPDVLAGKKTSDEVLREFLDTFDVGGEVDGKVTRQEFTNYYSNVSSSIDDDDYFELMIRNAWHISGGEGWSANSANRRVLVTHADGHESVEEIKDDGGVSGGDRNAVLQKLRAQGIHASNVEFFNASDKFDGEVRSKSKKLFREKQGRPNAPAGVLPGTGAPLSNRKMTSSPSNGRKKAQNAPVAVQTIIRKIKEEMKTRGAHGFIGMQRRFRSMDDDGSKSLDMAEFRKAMNEMSIDLRESDLRQLFVYFDNDQSGLIDFEEFVQGVRDPLSEKRAAMVKMAFKKIDKDRSGMVDAADIANSYDASKHPEVIAGRMTPEQVFRQFLDTFDVGGEVDGKVTMAEFENYYTNVGANIDSDDYFELMIRNAWHISGGEGWSANSANRRVLATDASGRESVEEIKDDMGLRAGDKTGAMSRLRAQGVDAHNIQTSGYVGDEPSGTHHAPVNLGQMSKKKKNDPGRYGSTAGASTRGPANLMKDTLGLQQTGDTSRPHVRRKERAAMDHGLANVLRMFKAEMRARGAHGYVGLQRKFRVIDDDGNKSLNMAEFKKGMKDMPLPLSDSEIRMLFDYFDSDESGSITFEEFLQGVRDPLTDRRRQLVRQAFNKVDRSGDGLLDGTDLIDTYDASKHPDVLSGKKSAHDVMEEFLDTFDVGGKVDGKVTLAEFENYYTNIGASIDNEDYFELMIRNAWHLSGGEGSAANSANRRVLVTHADGRQSVEEIKDDMGLQAGDNPGAIARLRRQGLNASSINLYGSYDNTKEDTKNPSSFRELVEHGRAGKSSNQVRHDRPQSRRKSTNTRVFQSSICIGDDGENAAAQARAKLQGGIKRSHSLYDSTMSGAAIAVEKKSETAENIPHSSSLANVSMTRNRDVPSMVHDLKTQLAHRGCRGIIGISRKFKSMDDNGNGALSHSEFRKALRECSIELSEQDFRVLFTHFDKDHSGDIDFEELLYALRGEMSDRRKNLVGMAFDKMDKTGNGIIDPEDVIDTYDASKHPDVLAGKKTSDEVLREFLDTFDVGGEVDGKVTRQEFTNYYSNVSSSIDDDDYFELMIRNAWHISGGEGWSANSANRRVLVTHSDGRQSVEEIKDDMGLQAGDNAGAIARLRAQGVQAANISLHDGMDTRKKEKTHSATYRTTFSIA